MHSYQLSISLATHERLMICIVLTAQILEQAHAQFTKHILQKSQQGKSELEIYFL